MEEISLCIMTRGLCHALFQGWENDPDIYMDMDRFTMYQYGENAVDQQSIAMLRPLDSSQASSELARTGFMNT